MSDFVWNEFHSYNQSEKHQAINMAQMSRKLLGALWREHPKRLQALREMGRNVAESAIAYQCRPSVRVLPERERLARNVEIARAYRSGVRAVELAEKYGLTSRAIRAIAAITEAA